MPSERILIVDDEETVREIISSHLAGAQFNTRQAASGMAALALLESGEEFDLVLSDLMMAEMDGIALLERVREKFPDLPVVMVTAVYDIQVALQARRNGAYDYLLKPFEREQLLDTVRRALEHRRLRREN
jgi:DNA-binding NtrC family response regulator